MPHVVKRIVLNLLRIAWQLRNLCLPFQRRTSQRQFALVSHVLPPTWSGQAMVIQRIIQHIGSDQYLLIDSRGYESNVPATDNRVGLPAEPGQLLWLKDSTLGRLSIAFRICLRAWRIARHVHRAKCRSIVACSGDLIDLPAAALASHLTGTAFVAYLFDDYLNQWSFAPHVQRVAKALEGPMLRKAAAVIVPNESHVQSLKQRLDIDCTLIRNPAVAPPTPHVSFKRGDASTPPLIVYTGAVYHVNFSAFRTLIAAMRQLSPVGARLEIYTAQDPTHLATQGICGDDVAIYPHVEPEEAAQIQRKADVLFMGFSFNEQVAEIVRTSAPGKLGDYLASGRPILALTPPNSFLATYFDEHQCGILVDREDPAAVKVALQQLLDDAAASARYVSNATRLASAEFSPEVAASRFWHLLEKAA
jgi:glycosyltransferase involved in cell wall biosynthesis